MDRLQFYSNSYFKELERKNSLNKSLSIPIGASTLLGSIIYYYLTSLFYFEANWTRSVFIILLILSAVSLIFALYNIIRSYFNYGYRYIPCNVEWENYHGDLQKFYSDKSDPKINEDLKEAVIEELSVSHKLNFENNNLKSAFLHRSNGAIIVTIILVLLTSLPYFANYHEINSNQKNNKITFYFMSEEDSQQQKPKPPKGKIIKEGQKPPKNKSSNSKDG